MKKYPLILMLIAVSCLFSQTEPDSILTKPPLVKNSLYLELVGNPTLYAINYDRLLYNSKYIGLSGTLGATYILGKNTLNKGALQTISMPGEINHAKYILGGTLMFRKELLWKLFNIQKISKNQSAKVSYIELGFFHIWNDPKISPANAPGGTMERGHPWNNIYVGYNLFRTNPGLFLRLGLMIYMFKKGPNVLDEISSGYRVSPLPFPRIIAGYTF